MRSNTTPAETRRKVAFLASVRASVLSAETTANGISGDHGNRIDNVCPIGSGIACQLQWPSGRYQSNQSVITICRKDCSRPTVALSTNHGATISESRRRPAGKASCRSDHHPAVHTMKTTEIAKPRRTAGALYHHPSPRKKGGE